MGNFVRLVEKEVKKTRSQSLFGEGRFSIEVIEYAWINFLTTSLNPFLVRGGSLSAVLIPPTKLLAYTQKLLTPCYTIHNLATIPF